MSPRPLTASQLRQSHLIMLFILLIGGPFVVWDFYSSITTDVPRLGVAGYLTGPIFAHKLSEIVIVAGWLWFAFFNGLERAGLWPAWMPRQKYYRSLPLTAGIVLWATVLATYSWTILNLGTSAQTTNIADPPGLGDEFIIWRYHLAAIVITGGVYVMVALRKLSRGPVVQGIQDAPKTGG